MSPGVEQTAGETMARAGGGVDMAAVTQHAATHDCGGTDSDEEYVATSFGQFVA